MLGDRKSLGLWDHNDAWGDNALVQMQLEKVETTTIVVRSALSTHLIAETCGFLCILWITRFSQFIPFAYLNLLFFVEMFAWSSHYYADSVICCLVNLIFVIDRFGEKRMYFFWFHSFTNSLYIVILGIMNLDMEILTSKSKRFVKKPTSRESAESKF